MRFKMDIPYLISNNHNPIQLHPTPILPALNSVHCHFTYPIFIRQFLNGKLAAAAGQGFFDGFDLGCCEF